MEVESPADGTLVRLAAAEGEVVPVGAPIATLETEAEDLLGGILGPTAGDGGGPGGRGPPRRRRDGRPAPGRPGPARRRRRQGPGAARDHRGAAGGGRRADPGGAGGPAAGRRARGRPVRASPGRDPTAWSGWPTSRPRPPRRPRRPPAARPAAAPVEAGDVEEVPLTPMRRVVARRLTESMQSAPHFYLTVRVDVTRLLELRAELNRQLAAGGQDLKVSVNDMIVKACAGLLAANRELNVSFGGDKLVVHQRVHVGVAVAVDGGLLVPVVRDADQKSLTQVAREAGELVGRARAGRLGGDDMGGGTFTVSNLGMLGVEQFTAVINPPEAAILAVGAAGPSRWSPPTGRSRSGRCCA